ncbi:hypothetical protein [Magnetospirillum sp. UT-4]|uniref:hypothetical protein n=1 Tax=Magnetospirillum sp. UT-4 TaxID=2681467 RepID=UPI0013837203|nr:hypothetical protein [Magnetospirillum sp. UT-4]CAA7621682.1 hypothetical protein MTBUT4_40071 [Magnetospirillum sp. UT-4]
MTDIPIAALAADRAADVRRFLQGTYGDGHYGAEARYFDWLYLRSPCRWYEGERRAGRMPVNAILDQAGDLAAIHAYLPFDARTPWGGGTGVWDVEWINGSGVRGGGRALATHLLAAVDVYGGFGCNDLSAAAFERLGMTVRPEIHRLVALTDADAFRALLDREGKLGEAGPLPAGVPPLAVRPAVLDGARAIPGAALEAYGERTPFGVGRDRDWLEWRYDRHPFIPYLAIGAAGGGAVLRLEAVVGTAARVARLLEFFPLPGGEAELLAAALAAARDAGAPLLDVFTTGRAEAALLADSARALDVDLPANPRLPYMFQPLEFARANAPNMVFAIGGRAGENRADPADFRAGKGDSNQDVLRDPASAPRLTRRP